MSAGDVNPKMKGAYGVYTSFVLNGQLYLNGNVGTSGQVLTSQGVGIAPIWANAPITSIVGTVNEVAVSTTSDVVTVSLPQNVIIPTPTNGNALSITGAATGQPLHITVGASGQGVALDGASGQSRGVLYETSGILRWQVSANQNTETGSNAGSDFGIFAYSDTGTYLGEPFGITRSTGGVAIGAYTVATSLTVTQNTTGTALSLGATGNTTNGSAHVNFDVNGNVFFYNDIASTFFIGGDAAGSIEFVTNNTQRGGISSTGDWVINAPTSGTALTVNGLNNTTAFNLQSGNGASTNQPDYAIRRNGSTANAYYQGPSLVLIDSSGSTTASLLQQSGGQTEIWQYNGSSYSQLAFWNANRGLTLQAPASGVALAVNGASGASPLVVNGNGNNSYVSIERGGTASGYIGSSDSVISGGSTSDFAISSASGGALVFGTNGSTNRGSISSGGNWTINAPSSGSALTISGNNSTSSAFVINSGMVGTLSASDAIINRAGSTVNQIGQGPNLQLFDTANLRGSLLQNSGGQTELWQYNGTSWIQALYLNASRGLNINAAAAGADFSCSNFEIYQSGNLPALVGGLGIAVGQASPTRGKLYIGDTSGWNFYISSRTGSADTDWIKVGELTGVTINAPSAANALTINATNGHDGVVVNTVSGTSAFYVAGSSGTELSALQLAQSGQLSWQIYQAASDNAMRFYVSGQGDVLILNGTGNVIINTPASPASNLNSIGGITKIISRDVTDNFASGSPITSGTITIDFTAGNVQRVVLGASGSNLTVNFTNVPTTQGQAQTMAIVFVQDATGGRTLPTTFQINGTAATVNWDNGVTPVLTTTANKADIIQIMAMCITSATTVLAGAQVMGNVSNL